MTICNESGDIQLVTCSVCGEPVWPALEIEILLNRLDAMEKRCAGLESRPQIVWREPEPLSDEALAVLKAMHNAYYPNIGVGDPLTTTPDTGDDEDE